MRYAALIALLLACPAHAELSVTLDAVSDYVYRGVSNNDEHPTPQVSVDWVHDSGVYVGAWGSHYDFNDGTNSHAEVDAYVGYATEWGDGWSTDLYVTRLMFLDNAFGYDYTEFVARLGYDFGPLALTGTVTHTPKNLADSGNAEYYELEAQVPLPHELTASAALGYWAIDDELAYGFSDYSNWRVGLAYPVEDFTLKLDYTDTDIPYLQCPEVCDSRFTLSISRSFTLIP